MPKVNWTKDDLIVYCISKGVEVEFREMKSFIWDKVNKYVADTVNPVVVTMD